MPDGDYLHDGLRRSYNLPYVMVCEWKLDPSCIAEELGKRLRKEVLKQRDGVADFLSLAANNLSILDANSDWATEASRLRNLKEHFGIGSQHAGFALQACFAALDQLEVNGRLAPGSPLELLYRGYIWRLYAARFGDAVPATNNHFDDVSQSLIEERLTVVKASLEPIINAFARQLAGKGEETRLRLPSQKVIRAMDLNVDPMSFLQFGTVAR